METIRSKFVQLTTDYEQISATKKDSESSELNARRKTDELNRSRQAVLDRTREEYEKLLRKYTDLDEVYRELVNLRDEDLCKIFSFFALTFYLPLLNTAESKLIRAEVERLHEENLELNKQRQTTSISHEIQMKKLHETYAIKLREAEQWPDRLQTELNQQRDQHQIEITELERRLRENFLAVCVFLFLQTEDFQHSKKITNKPLQSIEH